ncbi:MAG: SCO family protein [Candidatus Dadabacteria bacterium]|nr:SCO family protein [Candidatus Dadabacteria bacterium]NIY22040.1 SCO family protein [Candidatus Dadabacteria bacterium]
MFLLVLVGGAKSSLAINDVKDLKQVGIYEHLGENIPLDLEFYNTNNEKVALKSFFLEKKPVVLSLVYFSCPRVCNYATDGVVDVVNNLSSLNLGRDFKILTISFNSEDNPEIAGAKVQRYYESLSKEHFPKGNWHFLTGDKQSITKLTQSVGFKFKKEEEEFAHPSSLIIITPDGKISRYLNGIQHEAKDLKMALLEATNGEIGTSKIINKALLFCYQFDPVGKKYALQALNVVKAGGVMTLFGLGVFLTYFWKREKKISRKDGGFDN